MSTPLIAIAYLVVAAFLGAVGQYLYKSGADAASGTVLSYVFNFRILTGVLCYGVVMSLFISAFRSGGSLSVLYPIYGSTFIWASLISWKIYGTAITPYNVAGMVAITAGIYLMAKQ